METSANLNIFFLSTVEGVAPVFKIPACVHSRFEYKMGGVGEFAKFAVRELSKPHMWPFAVGGILVVVGAAMVPISDEDKKKSSEFEIIIFVRIHPEPFIVQQSSYTPISAMNKKPIEIFFVF